MPKRTVFYIPQPLLGRTTETRMSPEFRVLPLLVLLSCCGSEHNESNFYHCFRLRSSGLKAIGRIWHGG